MPRTTRFAGKSKELGFRQNLVELAQVIEDDGWFGTALEVPISAEIPQDAVADAALRDPPELFLDGLQSFARPPYVSRGGKLQGYREDGSEPAHRSGQIHILKEIFAPVAFEVGV